MVIKTIPSDTTFSYKCDWQYAERQNELNSYTDSAENYAIFFMVLDKTVFGHKEFEITDTTLFRHNNRKILKVRLDSLQVAGRSNFMVPIEVCEETTIWYQDCPWNNTTCAGPGGTCDNCWQCINYISWTYCWAEWIDSGGSGGGTGGTGGSGGSGGGSGGSGPGGSGTPPECQPTAVKGTNVNPNCEPGWNPVQNPVPIITYLTNTLGLSASQIAFLIQHPSYQGSLYNYISQNYSSQSVQICKDHIDFLMAEPEYVQFVNNHNTTGNHSIVWWMDDTWLDNPQYFNLDPYDDYRKLTAAEKALVKQYPTAAFIINQFNRPMANNYTVQKFGINGLNDKSDAFRHAFFQAINTVRVGAVITKKFADAHETEVPLQLNKEKQMDTLNNNIGIAYGLTQTYPASTPIMIANAIYTKVLNGELWYIKPLDFSASPYYDANRDGIQDCPTCLNGILSHSVLTPTNQ